MISLAVISSKYISGIEKWERIAKATGFLTLVSVKYPAKILLNSSDLIPSIKLSILLESFSINVLLNLTTSNDLCSLAESSNTSCTLSSILVNCNVVISLSVKPVLSATSSKNLGSVFNLNKIVLANSFPIGWVSDFCLAIRVV